MCNLRSVEKSFRKFNCQIITTNDIKIISKADKIILPGVGSFKDGMKELLGDADIYTMHIAPGMNANQKAIFLASLILTDYMFFERDSDMIKFENGCQTLTINCFMLYCCGVLCPCTCTLDARKDKDGDGTPDN
jgi:imidazoleglycerol phosphate synthase glutamine amidotransferase subunit HisH